MAHDGFYLPYEKFSVKQCLLARDAHELCLADIRTANSLLCPDTLTAYQKWCPPEVRNRYKLRKDERERSKAVLG